MSRFVLGLGCFSMIGLMVVAGEVEIVKTGYHIRQLNQKKLALRHDVKKREYHLAHLKTPQKLESWMNSYHVKLSRPKTLQLARGNQNAYEAQESGRLVRFARLLLPTAYAKSDD